MTRDAVREHLQRFWPDRRHEEFLWTHGRTPPPDLPVRRIAPRAADDPWVYATVAASEAVDGDGVEFFLLAPSESPRHVETLAMLADFHAHHWLGVGHIVDIGRPWAEGSTADHLLVTLPFPYGPALENCDGDGRQIRVLWVVPITGAEAAHARERGVEALEHIFERNGTDVLDPARASVA